MNWKTVSLVIRLLVAVVAGIFLFRFAGLSLLTPFVLVFYGGILFLLFGIPLLQKAGEKAAGLYLPDDSHFRIVPEYSTAEARVKVGRYADAVDEYRKVIAQYPNDIYPHMRIAELALNHLRDVRLAELELLTAFAKASAEDATVLAAGRLADLYQHTLHESARAIDVMRQLQARLPATKHVLGAQQRIDALEQLKAGHTPPSVPAKIAFKPTDEETLRRRRGY